MTHFEKIGHSFGIFLLFFSVALSQSPGDLLITPPRVIFEENNRTLSISLVNIGSDTSRYAISIINYRMTETGKMELIDTPDPGQSFAHDYIRFFPRQVVLAPEETQTIRMQVRYPNSIADGEYRSHLYFRAIDNAPLASRNSAEHDLTIQLRPIFGWAIPVIVRKGELYAEMTISDVTYLPAQENPLPGLGFTIHRKGTKSCYGDIEIVYENLSGEQKTVAELRGVAIYTPNTFRKFNISLDFPSGLPAAGRLNIMYKSKSDLDTKILAKVIVEWP